MVPNRILPILPQTKVNSTKMNCTTVVMSYHKEGMSYHSEVIATVRRGWVRMKEDEYVLTTYAVTEKKSAGTSL